MMKTRTRKQTETAKLRAENFVRNVKGDADRADEIANETVEDYAGRKRIQIENPSPQQTLRRVEIMATATQTKQELQDELEAAYTRIDELESHIAAGVDLLPDEDDDDTEDEEE